MIRSDNNFYNKKFMRFRAFGICTFDETR